MYMKKRKRKMRDLICIDCAAKKIVRYDSATIRCVACAKIFTGKKVTEYQFKNAIEMIGKKFGCLTVIEQVKGTVHNRRWRVKCVCGEFREVNGQNLRNGSIASCGCRNYDSNRIQIPSSKRTFNIWTGMLTRCYNKNSHAYDRYGGRGIIVCDRWHTYDNFLSDMGISPAKLSIDRINNEGNYEPLNCRWATALEQANNKRTRNKIEL